MRAYNIRELPIQRRAIKRVGEVFQVPGVVLATKGITGWPDVAFLCPGARTLLVEFKRPGDEPRPRQLYIHDQLRQLGYTVEVCDDVD